VVATCSGLQWLYGPNRAIPEKSDSIIINELHPYSRPENPLRLIRNQQVSGSIPEGGSI